MLMLMSPAEIGQMFSSETRYLSSPPHLTAADQKGKRLGAHGETQQKTSILFQQQTSVLSRPAAVPSSVEIGQMSSVETGHMSAAETGQMSAAETGQMSAVETRHMYSIKTGRRPVAIVYICPVSTADISISIDHSASAFRINNHHIMEAATAADLTQASEIPGRYITQSHTESQGQSASYRRAAWESELSSLGKTI